MLYVITAVHNRYSITEKFIDQLLRQTYRDIFLVLVDDGSTDGTDLMVKEKMKSCAVIQGDGNLWWGGALHKAYRWICTNPSVSDTDICMFANDDTEFADDYIERAVSVFSEKNNILLTGFGVSLQTGKQVDGAVEFDFKKTAGECKDLLYGNCASTRNLFFSVGDFKKIGGFHPKLLPHYGSDYEWTIRACRKHNYSVYCDPALVYYVNEDTTGDNHYESMTRKKLFSKRSVSNPFYKFSMIVLVTPLKALPFAIFNQILRNFKRASVIMQILKK